MPLDIQVGGIAENIRRVLGVRGRMPLRLDETVVPVVVTEELHVPPSRQIPSDFMGTFAQTNVAAEYPFVALNMRDAAGAVVVDRITFWAAAADTYVVHLGPFLEYGATATAPVGEFCNVEHVRDNTGTVGITPPNMPFQNLHGTHPVLGIGTRVATIRALAGEDKAWVGRITVRPGWALAVWRGTVNTTLECTFQGTYYPDAPKS